jgi:LysR family glycine cleavage system transcriptional activator
MDKLPPLHALHCFECVSRHLSVKLAAEELHVTPAAVSQQLVKLEAVLGLELFERSTRGMRLSPAGMAYFNGIKGAFRQIEDATKQLRTSALQSVITLSCTTVFAMQYLLPRLPDFHALYPMLDVRISTTHRLVDFAHDDVDFAVRHGLGNYPGLQAEVLIDDELVPVCSPRLLHPKKRLKSPEELAAYPLLHNENRDDWRLWLEAVGALGVDATRGTIFGDSNTMIEAAAAGHGVALARPALLSRQLQEGRLLMPIRAGLPTNMAYYLVYPRHLVLRPEAQLFRNWLLEQAGEGHRPAVH